ncbi:DeoR/GlpR family DNA-binding transcription regulator [Paenibacillus aurantius]|uniref:DeoR/GlpR family DNA-binding transcription regulator n=1 Tax=Paenibacillus aurantius TaxID=2918900 RepID=A0AA96LA73_9BACL|nr:DeoR/GlpR family DNA-binding transcription regulator [Paenibacillus aurantius]WNQ09540.1 DeoR/GlpR family DNA-binding transcription regulator [Paenibacillus aurantius]
MASRLNDRQQVIMDRLEAEGEIRLHDLKEMFEVTEMTIRRDLEKLEQAGLLRRTFGGAIRAGTDIALKDRTGVMAEEKARIGRKAASLILPGDCLFIDGGSTTFELVRALKPGLDITVVTNALNIANELQTKRIAAIVSGGMILEATSTLIGPFAESLVESMAFSRVFLGSTGVSPQHGFSNSNMYETEIKKAAIRKASEVNILLDHSKFGGADLFSFARLDDVQRVITDRLPDPSFLEACRQAGIDMVEA